MNLHSFVAVSLFAAAASLFGQTQLVDPTPVDITYIAASRQLVSVSHERLANKVSLEYRNATDEFTKRDVLQKLEPILLKELSRASAVKEITANFEIAVGEYDFSRGWYSLGGHRWVTETETRESLGSFGIRLEDFSQLEVPEPLARTLTQSGAIRRAVFRVTGTALQCNDASLYSVTMVPTHVEIIVDRKSVGTGAPFPSFLPKTGANARTISTDYRKNRLTAEKRWFGKRIIVDGYVGDISRNHETHTFRLYAKPAGERDDGRSTKGLKAYAIVSTEIPTAKSLTEGQHIYVVGVVNKVDGDIIHMANVEDFREMRFLPR